MTGIGSAEILLILLIAAIIAGPGNVKSLLSGSVKLIRKIKKYASELKDEANLSEEVADIKRDIGKTAGVVQRELCLEEMDEEIKSLKRELKKCTDKIESMKK